MAGHVELPWCRGGWARSTFSGPVGNALNHNLLTELVRSTTLVPPDLRRLELPG